MNHILELILHYSIELLVMVLEGAGVFVVMAGAVRSFWTYLRSHFHTDVHDAKLALAQTLAFALEFKLAAEILKMTIAQTMEQMVLVVIVIILHAILTFVIHYEIKFDTEHISLEKKLIQEQERIIKEENQEH